MESRSRPIPAMAAVGLAAVLGDPLRERLTPKVLAEVRAELVRRGEVEIQEAGRLAVEEMPEAIPILLLAPKADHEAILERISALDLGHFVHLAEGPGVGIGVNARASHPDGPPSEALLGQIMDTLVPPAVGRPIARAPAAPVVLETDQRRIDAAAEKRERKAARLRRQKFAGAIS